VDKLERPQSPWCSFCGKRPPEVRCVIVGPAVHICNECVRLCVEIMHQEHGVDPMSGPCPQMVNVSTDKGPV